MHEDQMTEDEKKVAGMLLYRISEATKYNDISTGIDLYKRFVEAVNTRIAGRNPVWIGVGYGTKGGDNG